MKKSSFLWSLAVVTALSFGFVSCGDDDDDNKKATTTTNTDNGNNNGQKNNNDTTAAILPTIYRTPLLTWGATKANVKAYMNGYTILDEDDEYIAFEGKDLETDQIYFFNEKGALSEADVYVSYDKTTAGDLTKQIVSEGFAYLAVKDSLTYYTNSDTTTIACLIAMPYYREYCVAYWNNVREEVTTTYFALPYMNWGCSRDSVKAGMAALGFELARDASSDTDGYPLYYNGKMQEYYSYCLFDKDLAYDYYTCIFQASVATAQELATDFEVLGFEYLGYSETSDAYYFYSSEASTGVAVITTATESGTFTLANFFPYTAAGSRSMDSQTNSDIFAKVAKSAKQNMKEIKINKQFNHRKGHKHILK